MPISYEEAIPLVGQKFLVHTSMGQTDLLLVEAQERDRRGLPSQFRTPLSLIFVADDRLALAQDNYTVEHVTIGKRQWMIVPVLPPHEPVAHPSLLDIHPGKLRYYQVLFS